MFIQQLYTNCLAEAAYYIESDGEAAVIDPLREPAPYLELAASRKARIRYVFETHFHADFVSGHIDLAAASGADIVFGPGANTKYKIHSAKDGEVFRLGKLSIKVMHTPGHTPESSCYLLCDEQGREHALFTGDTLFVGDVGRPDLLDGKMSSETLASMMYDSLARIKALPDNVIVYPAHGPGSQCGKSIGKETWSTIGVQKQTNYALREQSREEFIPLMVNGLLPPPAYFFSDARINQEGYTPVEKVMQHNMIALSVSSFEAALAGGACILDTRNADVFEKGFVPGSLNIGLNGSFAVWVGTLLDINRPLLLVTEKGREEESVMRLARVGYENVKGYLDGGIEAWKNTGKAVAHVDSIDPDALPAMLEKSEYKVLDVRKATEAAEGHLPGSKLVPLAEMNASLEALDKNQAYLVHCAGGYRSMIACSLMQEKGFTKLVNIRKGYAGIKNLKFTLRPQS